jgi:multiple sugar transport system substrate-binding protein
LFDEDNNPTFQDGDKLAKILNRWKLMYDEELVTPDALTQFPHQTYFTGEHTFFSGHTYQMRNLNDPEKCQSAGKVKLAMYPGETGESFIWTAQYVMGSKPHDRERAWQLLQFLGGKDPDGDFTYPKGLFFTGGVATSHKAVMRDAEVVEDLSKWLDPEIMEKQFEKSRTRDVDKALWFPEWNAYMPGQVHDAILGVTSVDEVITNLYDKAIDLKSKYEGSAG